MFEVGFTEIILIVGLALLVLGPEKLPGLVNKVGRWTGRARSMARQLRTQLEHEVTLDELTKSRPMQAGSPAQASSNAHEMPSYDPAPYATAPADSMRSIDDAVAAAPTAVDGETAAASGARPVDLAKH
jgi:sec-independent protein translocase protein TatB